jgi:fructose-specific phosphotransferase system IIA component
MRIGDYLKEDRVLLELKAKNKEEAIKEIASSLQGAREITSLDAFIKAVFEREAMATTGIGHDIAIPHARTDAVNDFIIALGRSTAGVEFGALDGRPVKLVFLMGTPRKKGLNAYLKILAHLSRLLEKESFRNSLYKASSPQEIIDEFKKVEK